MKVLYISKHFEKGLNSISDKFEKDLTKLKLKKKVFKPVNQLNEVIINI